MHENMISAPPASEKRPCRLQIVLCDDNKPFLKALQKMVRAVTSARNIDATIWAYDDANIIPKDTLQNAGIFILDIDYPEKGFSGIDVARVVRKENPDAVIVFISNYIQYAPAGYEVQAFRYVLKSDIPKKLEACITQAVEKLHTAKLAMHLRTGGEILSIPLQDILYLEAQGHQVVLHCQKPGTQNEKTYRCYTTLAKLGQEYSSYGFMRIQKSFLVNVRRVCRFRCNEAVLDTGATLPVSKKYYAEQKRQYLYWKGNNTWNMY